MGGGEKKLPAEVCKKITPQKYKNVNEMLREKEGENQCQFSIKFLLESYAQEKEKQNF